MMLPALLLLCQFAEPPRPAPPTEPRQLEAARPSPEAGNAAGRPRVVMVTSANCPPCAAAEAWIVQNGFPFDVQRQAPREGDSTPTWRFQGADGKWWQVVGWQGRATVEQLAKAYAEKNPRLENNSIASAPKLRANDAGKEALPDTLRRFAGESGTIVFRPDRKQRAAVTDGVTLDVAEITARYDLTGEPRITFDSPQPRGTVERFGFGVGFVVNSAEWQPPNTVRVGTNWKTIRISLDD